MAITYYTEDVEFTFKKKLRTKTWIKSTAISEGVLVGNIQIVFCSNKYILETNNNFLSHNYYTDIITFEYSEMKSNKKLISGDLIISIDCVKDNADEYGVEFSEELKRVIIHGVLHLVGYPDKQPDEALVMRSKENLYLNNF